MTRRDTSVLVLLYINQFETDWDELTTRELRAIVQEIKGMWPPDMQSHVWFDVEKQERYIDCRWETVVRVVCYHEPDKSQRAEIPQRYINGLVGRKIRIFPIVEPEEDDTPRSSGRFRRLEKQVVEIVYVLE